MKNALVKLRNSALFVLALLATTAPSLAGAPDPSEVFLKVGKERKLLLTIPQVTGNAEVRLMSVDGGILFQEKVQAGRYSRVFDLSKMAAGAYTVSITHNGKETAQPFTLEENAIALDPARRNEVALPQIKVEENTVELRLSTRQAGRVRVAIVSLEGELVFEDVVPATTHVQRRYNLSRLPKGSYTFAVHTSERALYQNFNR